MKRSKVNEVIFSKWWEKIKCESKVLQQNKNEMRRGTTNEWGEAEDSKIKK